MGRRGISWRLGAGCFLALTFVLGLAACGPPWWRKGRPRTKPRSHAEVELLSRLAELLMPCLPIGELFRDFTVEPSLADSCLLSPGIAVFGVLQNDGAALFVEYDGSDQGTDGPGCNSTKQHKTKALLRYAPEGSCVLRIGHATGNRRSQGPSVDVIVNTWRDGHEPSLMKAVSQSVWALLSNCDIELREDVSQRLHTFQVTEPKPRFNKARTFVSKAELTRDVETKRADVIAFLARDLNFSSTHIETLGSKFPGIWGLSVEGVLKPTSAWLQRVGLSRPQVARVVARFPQVMGYSIENDLMPKVVWLEDVGLSRKQVAKVIAVFPLVLRYSIEANLKCKVTWLERVGLNRKQVIKVVSDLPQLFGCGIEAKLKPTAAWLEDLGLSRKQVAKAISTFPQILSCSVEGKLKPAVAWLQQVGLSREHVAKVVATYPYALAYSLEARLKRTTAWLEDVGLDPQQVAKVLACHPPVLGYSVEANLKHTVAWLKESGLSRQQVTKVVAGFPPILGYSIEGNLKPTLAWLGDVGLSGLQVAKVVARLPQVLGYSIDTKLNPTVMWLRNIGLTQSQVARVIATFPQVLSLSIQNNLSHKHVLLLEHLSPDEVCDMILSLPALLGCSYSRLEHRLHVLRKHDALRKLPKLMTLTNAEFDRRFPS
ncbi:MTERF4 [Symbiodinium sp. CCMP2456]|nr:MTERF4 [Symbiodinium sp. CCMP2456]